MFVLGVDREFWMCRAFRQSLNLLTVAAVGSQMVMAVQVQIRRVGVALGVAPRGGGLSFHSITMEAIFCKVFQSNHLIVTHVFFKSILHVRNLSYTHAHSFFLSFPLSLSL